LYKKKFFTEVCQLARYILEAQSLIEYFIILKSDNAPEIIDWFDGNFIETRYTKKIQKKLINN